MKTSSLSKDDVKLHSYRVPVSSIESGKVFFMRGTYWIKVEAFSASMLKLADSELAVCCLTGAIHEFDKSMVVGLVGDVELIKP